MAFEDVLAGVGAAAEAAPGVYETYKKDTMAARKQAESDRAFKEVQRQIRTTKTYKEDLFASLEENKIPKEHWKFFPDTKKFGNEVKHRNEYADEFAEALSKYKLWTTAQDANQKAAWEGKGGSFGDYPAPDAVADYANYKKLIDTANESVSKKDKEKRIEEGKFAGMIAGGKTRMGAAKEIMGAPGGREAILDPAIQKGLGAMTQEKQFQPKKDPKGGAIGTGISWANTYRDDARAAFENGDLLGSLELSWNAKAAKDASGMSPKDLGELNANIQMMEKEKRSTFVVPMAATYIQMELQEQIKKGSLDEEGEELALGKLLQKYKTYISKDEYESQLPTLPAPPDKDQPGAVRKFWNGLVQWAGFGGPEEDPKKEGALDSQMTGGSAAPGATANVPTPGGGMADQMATGPVQLAPSAPPPKKAVSPKKETSAKPQMVKAPTFEELKKRFPKWDKARIELNIRNWNKTHGGS